MILVGGLIGGAVTAALTSQKPVAAASGGPSVSPSGDLYAGSGVVIERDGTARLCLGGTFQPIPPACVEPTAVLSGWEWSAAPAHSVARDIRFTDGPVTVRGRVTEAADGGAPTLTVIGPVYEATAGSPADSGTPTLKPSGLSDAELQAVLDQSALDGRLEATIGPHVASVADGVILAHVALDDGSLQRAADAQFGQGVVVVTSYLRPAPRSLRLVTTGFPSLSGMDAALVASLDVDEDGCVYARATGEPVSLVWPQGYTVEGDAAFFEILDRSGTVVARSGTELIIGGGVGGAADSTWSEYDCATGSPWVVGAIGHP